MTWEGNGQFPFAFGGGLDIRFGSLADLRSRMWNVRLTPKSGHDAIDDAANRALLCEVGLKPIKKIGQKAPQTDLLLSFQY